MTNDGPSPRPGFLGKARQMLRDTGALPPPAAEAILALPLYIFDGEPPRKYTGAGRKSPVRV